MNFVLSKETELTTALLEKIFQKNKAELARLNRLENYYVGKHEILKRQMEDSSKPNNKVVNPYPAYITDTLSGYFVGEPITYSSLDEEAAAELNAILTYNDVAAEDMELARQASIYGVAYELLYIDEDGFTRFNHVSPQNMIIIYDDSIVQDILYAIRLVPVYDIMHDKTTYRIEVYSDTEVRYYTANEQLTALTLVDTQPHYFNLVPVVEYKNNTMKLGDFETIIPLIDAYDKLESDSLNDYEYFVNAYLVLKGVSADADDIAAMKENRVLLLDTDAEASFLTKAGNDTTIENLKSRIKSDVHKFSKVPDLSDENFSNNASGVAIKFKLYGTETLVSGKERSFKKGLQRRIQIIFNILNLKGASFDWRAIDISFTRNLPTNETEIVNIIEKLNGICSTETLLAQIPFVQNVQTELERIQKQKETQPFYDLAIETKEDEE